MKEESGKCQTEEAKSGEGDMKNGKMDGERKAAESNGSSRSIVEDGFGYGPKSSVQDGDVAKSIVEGAKGSIARSIVKGDDTEDDVDDECGMKPWDRWIWMRCGVGGRIVT